MTIFFQAFPRILLRGSHICFVQNVCAGIRITDSRWVSLHSRLLDFILLRFKTFKVWILIYTILKWQFFFQAFPRTLLRGSHICFVRNVCAGIRMTDSRWASRQSRLRDFILLRFYLLKTFKMWIRRLQINI